jgi:UMF1 family MFS transporter
MSPGPTSPQGSGASKLAWASWCFYDWANSAFPTVIVTFVFATYYTQAVAESAVEGTADWGWAMSLSALLVAVLGPVLGAIADQGGRRKPWIFVFTALCIAATALLWFVRPDPSYALAALLLVALANVGFEFGVVFANAMLPALCPPSLFGRLSGWGWGLGYVGGLVCLVIALLGLVQADPAPFGLIREGAEHVRATTLLVALWMFIFVWPLFLFTPDRQRRTLPVRQAVRQGFAELVRTVSEVRQHETIARFLLARMIYTDGLNTLFMFGGIYAVGTFRMDLAEVIRFGIALNVSAGIGAILFAWVDDRIGAKPTLIIALVALIGIGMALLFVESKDWFWGLGMALGTFLGPAQAASRSLMARLAPPAKSAEMFGLYALSGKATAFIGPALLGWVTLFFDSQRAGMATILFFLIGGLLLLLPVKEPRG